MSGGHRRVAAAVAAASITSATPALAHGSVAGGGFLGGLLHPFFVPEHFLALIALGLLIGQQEHGRSQVVTMFAVGLMAGLAAIALAAGPSSANHVLVAVAGVAGLWTSAARPLPQIAGWPLAAVAGAAIGLDSPPEVASLFAANLMLVGTGLGALACVVAVAALVARLRRDWQRIGVRVAGSWAAAAAILVMAARLAG